MAEELVELGAPLPRSRHLAFAPPICDDANWNSRAGVGFRALHRVDNIHMHWSRDGCAHARADGRRRKQRFAFHGP